jgi:hypothetical protein
MLFLKIKSGLFIIRLFFPTPACSHYVEDRWIMGARGVTMERTSQCRKVASGEGILLSPLSTRPKRVHHRIGTIRSYTHTRQRPRGARMETKRRGRPQVAEAHSTVLSRDGLSGRSTWPWLWPRWCHSSGPPTAIDLPPLDMEAMIFSKCLPTLPSPQSLRCTRR